MKALSIHPYYALAITEGRKTIECRTWNTSYRGDILIHATAKKWKHTIPSHALCVAELVNVRPFTRKDLDDALLTPYDYSDGLFAWELDNIRYIKPIPLKGKLGLWEYNGDIEYIPEEEWVIPDTATDEEADEFSRKFVEKYWASIMT